jgi:hypothetical protein
MIDIPNLVPMIDTGAVAQSMAMKDEKNLIIGTASVKNSVGEVLAQPTMYLCLLLHLFTTEARVIARWEHFQNFAHRSPASLGDSGELWTYNQSFVESASVWDETHERGRQLHMGS